MKKTTLAITLVLLILFSIVAGILLVDWEGTEEEPEEIVDKLYTFPLSIGKKPTLLLLEAIGPLRQRGTRGSVSCNITIPADLIWGNLSVYLKDYKQSEGQYALSSNITHHSVQMKFHHIATVVIVSIRGTEGVTAQLITSSPSQEPIN